MPCWWRMQTRQTCHLWAVCTHVHSHLGRDTAASPRGKQQDTAIWSIGILFWMACNSSSIVAGFMGLNFFVWRFLRGRALNRERNGLLIPGWHWKASVHGRWQLDGQDTSTISSYVCVCVCGPMFFAGVSNYSPWRYMWTMRQSLRCMVSCRWGFFENISMYTIFLHMMARACRLHLT